MNSVFCFLKASDRMAFLFVCFFKKKASLHILSVCHLQLLPLQDSIRAFIWKAAAVGVRLQLPVPRWQLFKPPRFPLVPSTKTVCCRG